MKTASRFSSSLYYLAVGFCLASSVGARAATPESTPNSNSDYVQRFNALPLSFEANRGQVDARVKYLARGQGYTLFLTSGATVLGLRGTGSGESTQWVKLVLEGANPKAAVRGENELAAHDNYFIGDDRSKWQSNVPTFARVRYHEVYPGVDLVYHGRQGQLENDFEVRSGAATREIAWRVDGASGIEIDRDGDLIVSAGKNQLRLHRPRAYQLDGNRQREVTVNYRIDGKTVGFALGQYDPRKTLVIDPLLTYSTFLGNSGGEIAYDVAIDSSGDAYICGVTASTNFPVSAGSFQTGYAGSGDVFVAKLNPSATGILFASFLGGTGNDIPARMQLDPSGDIFLVGSTTSSNFPTTPIPPGTAAEDKQYFQPNYNGNQDAFLTEMKPDGSGLVYSRYIGGTGTDFGTALTLDSLGDVFVVGSTNSPDLLTKNPIQPGNVGQYDAFVAEVDPAGMMIYSTYLGGTLNDYGIGIALDSAGNIVLSGYTFSSNFPTQDALQSALAGGSDLFITKFTPGSSALLFSTYLGGASIDRLAAMTTDASGNIYLTGDTQSLDYPVTASAFQPSLTGTDNPFLTKVGSSGSALVYSTYLGGGDTGMGTAVAVDSAGNAYVTGATGSTNFPLIDPFQKVLGISGAGNCGSTNLVSVSSVVCPDAFVAKFGPLGIPVFSSFLGGSGTDSGQSIAVDSGGSIYVVGGTNSPNFPATFDSYQSAYLGTSNNSNAFLAKISPSDGPSIAISPQQINFGNEPLHSTTQPTTITLTNVGSTAMAIGGIAATGDFTQTNNCGTSLPAAAGSCTIQVTFDPTSVGLKTEEVTINDNAGSGTQAITLTGNGVLSGGSLILNPSKLTFAAQAVGTTSAPQTALLVNNGNRPVTITNISMLSNDFTQTNNCGPNFPTVPATLNVGQSCTISVNFTPTASGTLTSAVAVQSDAVNGTTSPLSLTGTGSPVFSLSASSRSTIVTVGTPSVQFTVTALAPSNILNNSIQLSCNSQVTCAFSNSSLSPGDSTVVTVTSLSSISPNPLNVTVTGKSNNQTSSVSLSIFFADFSISATPAGTLVKSGSNATYTISVTPKNGFNLPVLLSCPAAFPGIPVGTSCFWNPPIVVPTGEVGTTVPSTLTITTLAQTKVLPRGPNGRPPTMPRWILVLGLLALTCAILVAATRARAPMLPHLRLAVLLTAIVLTAFAVACENYVNPININPVVNGTPSGNYSILITGTLGNGSNVTRYTVINLSVVP